MPADMTLDSLVASARQQGASDLHLETDLPVAVRVRGALHTIAGPLPAKLALDMAQSLIGPEQWPAFLERRSFDLSRTIQGVRCRISLLHTARGIGLAIRL